MATKKHAQIRYTIKVSSFSNFNRLYDYRGILKEVNNELYIVGGRGCKTAQIIVRYRTHEI